MNISKHYLRALAIRITKTMLWLLLVLVPLILGLSYYYEGQIRGDKAYTTAFFNKHQVDYTNISIPYGQSRLHAIKTGNHNAVSKLLFVHGAPGSWNAWEQYLVDSSMLQNYEMIAVDRLGNGQSDYGNTENSIVQQTQALHTILSEEPTQKWVIIGHSYGGPIAAQYGFMYPNEVAQIIMLAPAIDPYSEKYFWFNDILKFKFFQLILPKYINTSVNEKLSHAQALKDIEMNWTNYTIPISHIHCEDDQIVPFLGNKAFVEERFPSELLHQNIIKEGGHIFVFTKKEMTQEIIKNCLLGN